MKNHKNYNLCILLHKNLPPGSQLLKFYVKKKKKAPLRKMCISAVSFFFFLTKIELLIKNLAKTSENKNSLPSFTSSIAHTVYVRVSFFPSSCWIVWFQFKLLVSISQLCTTLSNLFLLGIFIWNETLLSVIYLKQTSVPTWWFNCNWLSSKKWAANSGKMHGSQPADTAKTLSRDANYILLFETAAVQPQTFIFSLQSFPD